MTEASSLRGERYAAVLQLRKQGKLQREIGEALGISRSYVSALLTDPTGKQERKRKRGYAGVCVDCGAATTGCNGRAQAPQRCHPCQAATTKVWTRDAIIEGIQKFARDHGRPPTATDLAKRGVSASGYPPTGSIYHSAKPGNVFESFAAAIEAAGFPRPAAGQWQGRPDRSVDPRQMRHRQHAILRYGRRSRRGFTKAQLAAHFEIGYETAKKAVNSLEHRGLVERTGTRPGPSGHSLDVFELTDAGRAA